jgi:hypothetical protein
MQKNKRTSTVSANINKKRLYITLQGIISKKEAERIYTDIRFCVSDLEPGFAVITDLSHCRIGHLSAIATFRKIMGFLLEKHVGQIVRITGQARIVYLQMLKLTDKVQSYEPMYVTTQEEAEKILDELVKKKSIA